MTQNKDATGAETRNSLEINYERTAAEAINKVKQDLATKDIRKDKDRHEGGSLKIDKNDRRVSVTYE